MDPVFTSMEPIKARAVPEPLLNNQLHKVQTYIHPVTNNSRKRTAKLKKSLPNRQEKYINLWSVNVHTIHTMD